MNKVALKMAGYNLDGVIADIEKFDGLDDVCIRTIKRVRSVIAEAISNQECNKESNQQPANAFCDSNCVWTDHHPDCVIGKQPAQEPMAWMNDEGFGLYPTNDTAIPLYTHPHQWQELTDDDFHEADGIEFRRGAAWAEQMLWEKNHENK